MKKRQVINIINFIRGVEPREPMDLLEPVREQIRLMQKHQLKGTFLLQYDALIDPAFIELLRPLDPQQFEIGVWFEIVQPLAEQAGLSWRGRFPWDWHAHCGFSVGYSPAEREQLVDILFDTFHQQLGFYPKSFGSWAFDAHTLEYAHTRYGLHAACNCKDQWGTDGYNLWGGYYGQGYYPSRFNAFSPAQTKENQISVPIFRMLGSDPVRQYDTGLNVDIGAAGVQGVLTLEPVYKHEAGGGMPDWVDWYFSQNYNQNCLTFAYAQAGQENSFGWNSMKDGLEYQFAKIRKWMDEDRLEAETMGETGRWYQRTYSYTPPSVISALEDWNGDGKRSVWYNCKNYRINIYMENNRFWIRDIHLFRETYPERYLQDVCTTHDLTYDTLPYIDGNQFSGNGIRSGLYPVCDEKAPAEGMPFGTVIYSEENGRAILQFLDTPCGEVTFRLSESGVHITKTGAKAFLLKPAYNQQITAIPDMNVTSEQRLVLRYRDFSYSVCLSAGRIEETGILYMENEQLAMVLKENRKGV